MRRRPFSRDRCGEQAVAPTKNNSPPTAENPPTGLSAFLSVAGVELPVGTYDDDIITPSLCVPTRVTAQKQIPQPTNSTKTTPVYWFAPDCLTKVAGRTETLDHDL